MTDITRRLVIHGRVQGVFFRGWMVDIARELGLGGWVRNRGDGTVEALARGPETAVESLIARCRDGPPAARVGHIDVDASDEEVAPGFEQRRTI